MCHRALLNPDEEAIQRGLAMADNNQWETIVAKLENHIDEVLKRKAPPTTPRKSNTRGKQLEALAA